MDTAQGPESRRQQKRTVSPLAADPTELVVIWVFLKKLRLWGSFKATRRFEKEQLHVARDGGSSGSRLNGGSRRRDTQEPQHACMHAHS